ncbi:hypothetical protein D1AOALGA4SA_323 [Olavius algarvensis Delta 1 endosymbiont]|nr:hypothetical protein D1AOALGA4SA_323 [Olavius algarvensis Delta 1 endosymbiont]
MQASTIKNQYAQRRARDNKYAFNERRPLAASVQSVLKRNCAASAQSPMNSLAASSSSSCSSSKLLSRFQTRVRGRVRGRARFK